MYFKEPPLKSNKLRKAARGGVCVACRFEKETTCGRHYNGIRQHMLGKGRNQKCHDFAIAELCDECERPLSEGMARKSVEHSEEFLFYCMLTLIRRHAEGVLEVK
ncbi:MAG: hypothetical protein MJA83_10355 [Gammaproteobacteria bacterium]|nr:hypothetical protein [Gammaproteobacteria bacterium]